MIANSAHSAISNSFIFVKYSLQGGIFHTQLFGVDEAELSKRHPNATLTCHFQSPTRRLSDIYATLNFENFGNHFCRNALEYFCVIIVVYFGAAVVFVVNDEEGDEKAARLIEKSVFVLNEREGDVTTSLVWRWWCCTMLIIYL